MYNTVQVLRTSSLHVLINLKLSTHARNTQPTLALPMNYYKCPVNYCEIEVLITSLSTFSVGCDRL